MFVFYDWPFQHVFFAKNVALAYSYIIPFNSLLRFQAFSDCVVFYGNDNLSVGNYGEPTLYLALLLTENKAAD